MTAHPSLRGVLANVSLGIGAALIPLALAGQSTPGAAPLPRTSWGDPDLSGVWDFRTLTPLERPRAYADRKLFTDEEARAYVRQLRELLDFDRRDGGSRLDVERAYNNFWYDFGADLTEDRRTSLIVDPEDGRIPPLTERAEAELRARRKNREPPVRDPVVLNAGLDGPEHVGLSERCLVGFNAGPPMQPSAYNNNVRIVQTPGYVVLLNEMIHDARIVPMDGRPHVSPQIRRWMGDSLGRFEGDTLVVDTTNFTDKTPAYWTFERGALGSGETLHLVERFTRSRSDTLVYEFTIDDPTTFTRPWTAVVPMKASAERLFEYACHEGNYAMRHMLEGERARERMAAKEED